MLIKISDIAIVHRQRKEMDPAKVKQLAESIRERGLLHPVVVRTPFEHELEAAQGKPYVLSVGGRRLAAHMMLDRLEIEANLKDSLDPISAEIVELDENIQREDITWQEEVDARTRIAELLKQQQPEANIRDIAEQIGVSPAQLSKDISLHELAKQDPSLRNASSKGTALRTAAFKQEINQRLARVETSSASELSSKIVLADARDYIRTLTSQSVDLLFTDLPYGLDYFEVTKSPGSLQSTYDDAVGTTKELITGLVPEIVRVVKPSGWIVLFMSYELHAWLMSTVQHACGSHSGYRVTGRTQCREAILSSGPCRFLIPEPKPWIWTRVGSGNYGHWPELHAASRYEMLVVVNGGQAKLAKKPVEDILPFAGITSARLHAMQKPHDLCREIIERTTVVGELVVDVCCGSGAHLAAAADLGRDFRGCDNNPENIRSAISLVAQYKKR